MPRLQILHHGNRRVLDRPSAFLSHDIGSVLKGGAKVCQQQQLVSEVLAPLVTEFARNLGREAATPIHGAFNASFLGRVQAIKLIRHNLSVEAALSAQKERLSVENASARAKGSQARHHQ